MDGIMRGNRVGWCRVTRREGTEGGEVGERGRRGRRGWRKMERVIKLWELSVHETELQGGGNRTMERVRGTTGTGGKSCLQDGTGDTAWRERVQRVAGSSRTFVAANETRT